MVLEELNILYKDSSILVAVKPVGYLSEPAEGKSFPNLLSEHLVSLGESGELFTVHRLDKAVGGLMVFARNHKAASFLTTAVANREMEKEYFAVVRGVPQEEATLEDLLFRDASKNKTYVVSRYRKGVRDASLSYRRLAVWQEGEKSLSLVRVRLHTGRTHQIRVQFASRKMPLVGDIRYGSKDVNRSPALFSCRLAFTHPATGKKMEFSALPPQEYPWDVFRESLLG